ncbi:MAG TPA: TolC family protein [Bryobacteraceae bacterium]|nr:TolC family protein [Bryobacteraceae bacterium]
MSKLAFILLFAAGLQAEVHTLSLPQAVARALEQNPDILLARLDERKAQEAVRIARDPFTPRINVGSGLAYSSGFPMSIEGSAPSVFQAQAAQYLFNRPQSYVVAQAKETARGASIATAAKRDEVAFRIVSLYLDAERAARVQETARKELASLEKVAQSVGSRVEGGYELPIVAKRAAYNVARARLALENLSEQQEMAQTSLAVALGYSAEDRVEPSQEERTPIQLPSSEENAIEQAVHSSAVLRQLESQIAAKGLDIRGARSARLPRVDLVAQYGLFAKFNHYEDYFRTFQRNNGQLGVSLQIPLLTGPGVSAQTAQSEAEIARLRLQMTGTRNQIMIETRQAFRDIRRTELARDAARADLEVAREQVSVNLALAQEGRLTLRELEESRVAESDKWIAFYDAQYAVERARWALLRNTGDLLAALR